VPKRERSGANKQLWQQVQKWSKLSNLGSKSTRKTHMDKMSTFVSYVGDTYRLQNLKNLSDKHLVGYAEWAKTRYDASTIKNTISAVRFIHKQIPQTRYQLSDNKIINEKLQVSAREKGLVPQKYELPQRHYLHTGKNMSWTDAEYLGGIALAEQMKRLDVALALRFARYLGFRIHEITKTERVQLIRALEDGYITVKGKGGLVRDVKIDSKAAHDALQDALKETRLDKQKVFVERLGNTHAVIRSIENWVYRHRTQFAESPDRQLTMHGLRHAYAQEQYRQNLRITDGDEKAARILTAASLGHGRDWVTKIYLD
jgi:integrase/recombinase XerD